MATDGPQGDDDDYIAECVAAAPPLSAEQRARLKELLRPVRKRRAGTHPVNRGAK